MVVERWMVWAIIRGSIFPENLHAASHPFPRHAPYAALHSGAAGVPGRAGPRPVAHPGRRQRHGRGCRAAAGRPYRPRAVPRPGLHRRPGAGGVCAADLGAPGGGGEGAGRDVARVAGAFCLGDPAGPRPFGERLCPARRLYGRPPGADRRGDQRGRTGLGAGPRNEPRHPAPHLPPDDAAEPPDAAAAGLPGAGRAGRQQKPGCGQCAHPGRAGGGGAEPAQLLARHGA